MRRSKARWRIEKKEVISIYLLLLSNNSCFQILLNIMQVVKYKTLNCQILKKLFCWFVNMNYLVSNPVLANNQSEHSARVLTGDRRFRKRRDRIVSKLIIKRNLDSRRILIYAIMSSKYCFSSLYHSFMNIQLFWWLNSKESWWYVCDTRKQDGGWKIQFTYCFCA